MLVDPTGCVYDDIRLEKNPPQSWINNTWILYKIRGESKVKETVYLTGFIDLAPYK